MFNYGSVGDALMSVSLLARIRAVWPEAAYVLVATKHYALVAELVKEYPWLLVCEGQKLRTLARLFLQCLHARTSVLMRPTFGATPFRVAFFATLLSVRNLRHSPIGFVEPRGWGQWIYARRFAFDECTPLFANLCSLLPEVGVPNEGDSFPRFIFDLQAGVLETYGLTSGAYLVFHLPAANPARSLPVERWARILRRVHDALPRVGIVLSGAAADEAFIRAVSEQSGVAATVVIGESLHTVASLIRYAKRYIGPDTGVTHIAALLRVPSVVIGNNSNPSWLPTYNPNAVILTNNVHCTCDGRKGGNCFVVHNGQRYYRCMLEISEERIVAEIVMFPEGRSPRASRSDCARSESTCVALNSAARSFAATKASVAPRRPKRETPSAMRIICMTLVRIVYA